MSKLTILCGFPGSGKSFTLKQAELDPVVLCPDDFRFAASGKWFHPPIEEFIWGTVKLTARTLLMQGYHIIIDATHLTTASRAQWIKIANEANCPIDCVWIYATIEQCRTRNSQRDDARRVPDEVLDRMVETFVEPSVEEGFDRVIHWTAELNELSNDVSVGFWPAVE